MHTTRHLNIGRQTPRKLTLTTTRNRRVFGVVWNTLLLSVVADVAVNLTMEAIPVS